MDTILDLAKKFIAIYSTSDNEIGLKESITCASYHLPGLELRHFNSSGKPSLLAHNTQPGNTKFTIILNGHLDVVPGKEKQFAPYIKDNKLYGRGAYDMKAAAAVLLIVFKELVKKVPYPLALQLVTDEEIGGHNGTKYQIEQGITADFVIAGEPSDFKIINESKSLLWIKVKIFGKTAHAAYPWLGENALAKTTNFLGKLQQIYQTPKKPSWQTTVNIAKISTPNVTFNKIPDECTVWLDLRIIPKEEHTVLQTIKKILPRDSELTIQEQEKPAYTDPKNTYVTKLQKTIQRHIKNKSRISGTHGATDLRFYNTLIDVPGIEFGPIGEKMHADDEWVDLKSLEEYYHILKQFLLSVS